MRKAIFKSVSLMLLVLLSAVFIGAQKPKNIDKTNLGLEYDLPIIMYHSTYKKNPNKYNLPPKDLEKDFVYILECGYTPIFMSDLIEFKETGKPLPKKPIIVSFDDAYTNNYLYAFPIMKELSFKCVISVVGKYTDDNYKNGELHPTGSHMTYEEIDEMNKSGLVEIQSHTYNLHNNSGRIGLGKRRGETYEQYKKSVSDDLMQLQNKLKEKLNITCTTVAYPFGSYSIDSEKVLKELGFKAALTCNEGINKINKDTNLFYLKRYNRPAGISAEKFFGKIEVKI